MISHRGVAVRVPVSRRGFAGRVDRTFRGGSIMSAILTYIRFNVTQRTAVTTFYCVRSAFFIARDSTEFWQDRQRLVFCWRARKAHVQQAAARKRIRRKAMAIPMAKIDQSAWSEFQVAPAAVQTSDKERTAKLADPGESDRPGRLAAHRIQPGTGPPWSRVPPVADDGCRR